MNDLFHGTGYCEHGETFELTAAAPIGMRPVLIKTSESHSEVRREARERRGAMNSTLSDIFAEGCFKS